MVISSPNNNALDIAPRVLYSRTMFRKDFAFTKRQLGFLLLIVGVLGFCLIFGIDLVDAGREGGVGPVQRVALLLMVSTAILGMTLIPLGDDLA